MTNDTTGRTTERPPRPERLGHPLALFAVALVGAAAAAAAIGFSVGALVATSESSDCSATDGWCDLGAALVGLLLGVATAAITYVGVGVGVILHARPAGRRLGPVLVHVTFPIALYVAAAIVFSVAP